MAEKQGGYWLLPLQPHFLPPSPDPGAEGTGVTAAPWTQDQAGGSSITMCPRSCRESC